MTKAKIGDVIEFKEGIQGIVEVVYENSVIVDLTYNDNDQRVGLLKTVVNHRNYKIIKKAPITK